MPIASDICSSSERASALSGWTKPSSSTAFVDPSTFAGEMTKCLGLPFPQRRTNGEIALGDVPDEK
jgi:hypothetical protein